MLFPGYTEFVFNLLFKGFEFFFKSFFSRNYPGLIVA